MNTRTRCDVSRVIRLTLVSILLAGCHHRITPVTVPDSTPVVALLPADSSDAVYEGLASGKAVFAFYQDCQFKPQWSAALADSLVRVLEEAQVYGLPTSRYALESLQDPGQDSLRRDVLLTDAFFSFGHDLRWGITDTTISPAMDSVRAVTLRSALQERSIRAGLESLEPPFDGYRQLRLALGRLMRSPESTPAWKEKTARIAVNLQRWRSEPRAFGARYILVQVPAFMLYVVEKDSVLFSSRVIVGEPETPTPELTSEITRLVTYPYWHVPRKIAVKEYLPAIQQNVEVLNENNFEVLDRTGRVLKADSIPWASYSADYFPVLLRQKEGRENALGIIKFEFKNPYAVFLHDTNARRLFREDRRAFSHGCIRMERAEWLAHYLVTGRTGSKSTRLTELLAQQKRHTIRLSKPIPIYVRYFTAEVRDGRLQFHPDVYCKDGIE